jgi:hypothetical protein
LEEWLSEGSAVTFADDTTCYAMAPTHEEVRRILVKSAEEILTFMKASMLSANPEKTKFIMFGRGREEPITVGDVQVSESTEEVLLGITFNKSLSWKSHLDKLESELRKRVGILRRMTWQLPRDLVIKMIEPIFTAKLRYALELVTDTTKAETDMGLKRLHKLHRAAMKAALGIQMRDHPEDAQLLQQTRQASVHEMALRATAGLAWKCAHNWGDHPLTSHRVEGHQSERNTRQATSRSFPPQHEKSSLVSRLVETWEKLPVHIQGEEKQSVVKKKIKSWAGRDDGGGRRTGFHTRDQQPAL